jgi:hypothetical protein
MSLTKLCLTRKPARESLVSDMDEGIERDNTWGGEGAFLRCPVSNSVQFSLRNEGSTEYMCVRGEITGDNIYRCQSACPEGYNDFDFLKETK